MASGPVVKLPNLAGFASFIEKCAAYFAVGGVGAANVGALPNSVRAVLAVLGGSAIVVDRHNAAKKA